MPKQKGGQKAEKVRAGGKLGTYSRRIAISFEAMLPKFLSGLLDSFAFVGRFDLAKPRLLGSDLVDGPCGRPRRCFWLSCHISLLRAEASTAGEASCASRSHVFHRR